jgi:hypothetical protein
MTMLNTRLLMVVRIVAAPPYELGAGPRGTRRTFPITGGNFEGPRLRGRVLEGGGDWGLVRPDGVLELSLRATLQTDDGALIAMTFEALRDGERYFRSVPRFEAADERYSFLNRLIAIGDDELRAPGAVHTFYEVL